MATKITVKAEIEIPRLPNYVKLAGFGDDTKLDVADISDESLASLGEAWTAALLVHARERRALRARSGEGASNE